MDLAKAEKKRQEKACESTNPQIKEIAETALPAQEKVLRVLHLFKQFATDEELDFECWDRGKLWLKCGKMSVSVEINNIKSKMLNSSN